MADVLFHFLKPEDSRLGLKVQLGHQKLENHTSLASPNVEMSGNMGSLRTGGRVVASMQPPYESCRCCGLPIGGLHRAPFNIPGCSTSRNKKLYTRSRSIY